MTARHAGRVETEFARIALAEPNRPAITESGSSRTYGELWADACIVAGQLGKLGVRQGDPVALIGHCGSQSVITMLAVLIAAGHYVPVDPGYPAPRVAQMVGLSQARMIVTCDGADAPDVDIPIHAFSDLLAAEQEPMPATNGETDALLYIMFTSGSTGQPKPVGITHRGATGLALQSGVLRLRPSDVMLGHSTLAFDASTFEIWSTLLTGAHLVAMSHHPGSAHEIAAAITANAITVAWLTAPVFGLVAANHLNALGELRMLVTGGDVVPPDQARAFARAHPNTTLINGYGPTENTTFSTAFPVHHSSADQSDSIPIGQPVAGSLCYILDDQLTAVAPGAIGELVLGGDRLAVGYLGSPSQTATRFVPDPFQGSRGARMYRTGDQVRALPDGQLEFVGRLDDEVKIRGFRVTLGEVRTVVASAPGVRDAAILVTGEGPDRALAGFVTPSTIDVSTLRAHLKKTTATQLIPDLLFPIERLPLLPNGKVDKAEMLRLSTFEQHGAAQTEHDPLAKMWQRWTGAPASEDADFFVSGGTSLNLMRLIEDIRTEMKVELSFAEVYATASFAELRGLVSTQAAASYQGNPEVGTDGSET